MRTEELVADLTSRLSASRELLELIGEQRVPHALPASQGDVKAKAALAKLSGDAAKASRDVADLQLALEQAKTQHAENRREIAERAADAALAAARGIGADIVAEAGRVDEYMAKAAKSLDRIAELVNLLARGGASSPDHLNRLRGRDGPKARAARHAGLGAHIELATPVGSGSNAEPLAPVYDRLLRVAIRRPTVA